MASIEKTVFISYRRKDSYTALAVYQHLTGREYDVFLDYTSIPSGDFEQIIVSNIKARAHFVLILTPTALDRCNEPGDWLRREIEIAIDEKRNIIPLFFDGFRFSAPGVAEKLTGKLGAIRRYNGLEIPPGYFNEAMERLCEKYLNVPLDAVLHPVPTEVRKVVREERVAAEQALQENKKDIEQLLKPFRKKSESREPLDDIPPVVPPSSKRETDGERDRNWRLYGIGAGILVALVLGIAAINSLPPLPTTSVIATDTPTATITFTETPTFTPIPPPSGRITFSSDRDGDIEIYMMNVNGTTLSQLTENDATDSGATWSPDGKKIAFVSNRDGNFEIYMMNADGSDLIRLTNNTRHDYAPAWSPDGDWIAFYSERDNNYEIYMMNIHDGRQIRLTESNTFDEFPAWSPDARKIAFSSNRTGNSEIYVLDLDDSSLIQITTNTAEDSVPDWSPDGSKIVFVSNRDGNAEIYVMDSDGRNPIRLTNIEMIDDVPAWSPDGNWIAFQSNRDGNFEIYMMHADGSNQLRLTSHGANDTNPVWSKSLSLITNHPDVAITLGPDLQAPP